MVPVESARRGISRVRTHVDLNRAVTGPTGPGNSPAKPRVGDLKVCGAPYGRYQFIHITIGTFGPVGVLIHFTSVSAR